MLLYENKKAKFLNVLRIGINPFKNFVSTGEIKEELEFVPSRREFLRNVINVIENNENFILPIIGKTGIGKTHLYWALKNELYYYNVVYISLENVYKKFYYNTYSKFIETLGVEPLRNLTNQLCNKWGALEKKFGFFHIADIDKVRKIAFEQLSENFEDKTALMDAINAITAHQLDPFKKVEAENWLLGELMDFRDLSRLKLSYDLRRGKYAYTTLKILIENSKSGSIIFIDDFEKIISLMKPKEITEEIFDPSWLYGSDKSTPESIAAQKIFNKIIKLLKIKRLKIIVTLKSIESFEDIKKIIPKIDEKISLAVKDPLFLPEFVENDIYQFYKRNMELFLESINYLDNLEEFTNSYFPLNEKVLKNIFFKTNGNPREILKLLIKIFDEIIFSGESLESILANY